MKKSMLMLAVLSFGTAALAQTSSAQPTPPDGATPAPPMTPDAPTPPAMSSPTQAMPMDPAAPSAPMTPAAPDAAASMPMAPPAAPAPMAGTDTSNYPVCSKTVQDKCVSRSAASHKAMRKR